MAFDEEAFMRLDSASSESIQQQRTHESEEEEESHDGNASVDPDTDNKLMEYLLKGYVLSSACCKSCSTPLINNMTDRDDIVESCLGNQEKHPAGRPVKRVPFCVSCSAVVVKTKEELQILWQTEYKHLMAQEGAVILDFDDNSVNPVFAATDKGASIQVADEDEPTFDTVPIKYETGDGLLVISSNGNGDEDHNSSQGPAGDDGEVAVEIQPETEVEEKPEFDFDMIDYKKR